MLAFDGFMAFGGILGSMTVRIFCCRSGLFTTFGHGLMVHFQGSLTVKPRKLEHHSPPALEVKYKGS